MGFSWRRPENLQFPSVWYRFKANSDNLVEYRVQDLPVDRFEEALHHMSTYFIPDEPMCATRDLMNDEVSIKGFKDLWRSLLQQHITLVCFKEGSDEIVGLNMVGIVLKEEKDEKYLPLGKNWIDIYAAVEYVSAQFNVFETYKVDKYMTAFGLLVNRDYRGRGIGEHLLRARIPLGKAIGVQLTSTIFSAIASQKSAFKAGFELNYEITYDELAKIEPKCIFPGIKTKTINISSMRI